MGCVCEAIAPAPIDADNAVDLDEALRQLVGDEAPVLNHYMRKATILAGVVEGAPGRTLCGDVFVLSARGGGQVSDARAVICPTCATLYGAMEAS